MNQTIKQNNEFFHCTIEDGIAVIHLQEKSFEIITNLEASNQYIDTLKAIDREQQIVGVVQIHDSTFADTATLEQLFIKLQGQADQSVTQLSGLLERYGNLADRRIDLFKNFTKPLIAGFHGEITLELLGLALPFDLRVATHETTTVFSNLKMGFPPSGHLGYSLSRFIGMGRAMEIFVSGRPLSSEQLLAFGLVTKLTTKEELLSQCLATAKSISGLTALGLRATRLLMQNDDEERKRFINNSREVFKKTLIAHLRETKGGRV